MNLWIFLASLAASVFAFELAGSMQHAFSSFGKHSRLDGVQQGGAPEAAQHRSVLSSLLITFLPSRFDINKASNKANVIDLLRRAGYPYSTPGEFYAASMQTFARFLIIGGAVAAALVALDMTFIAAPIALIFVVLGFRRPYVALKTAAKKRAEATRNNMLIGLSVLNALLNAGVGVQEALRRTANVGGPFCNLLGLLVARMNVDDFGLAIETTRQHIPDLRDIEVSLFFRDVDAYFRTNRPLANSVNALREAVHRSVVEETEAKAALVRQRSGLFGVMAVLGLVLSIIAPFMGAF